MIFEFLISYREEADKEITGIIRETLAKVLQDNLNDFDDDAVQRMVVARVVRPTKMVLDEDGTMYRRALLGFALDVPDETLSCRMVVDEFAEALNSPPVFHLVKFEDPLLRLDLARWSEEIFALEMKLRRVLSLVYLNAYGEGDPYDLLREETVQPMAKERPSTERMKEHAENQFFHLTFSQYIALNRRPEFKLPDLLEVVRSKELYPELREELARLPVEDEDDANFMAGLKERMDAIEAMRNCCAHSRRPSRKVEENYRNARPLLERLLGEYLARWEWEEPEEETPWDRAAREAVEGAMEGARWDDDTRTITVFAEHDERIQKEVTSKKDLQSHLAEVARAAFYAHAPRAEGNFLYETDGLSEADSVLIDYEEQLDEFFGGGGEPAT
jgi:hypothetical protein